MRTGRCLSGTTSRGRPYFPLFSLCFTFQDAYTLTALDKRTFAPPLESQWQRVVNMANACESFKMNPKTVVQLIDHGFKSVTLLSMAKTNMIKLPHRASEQQHFKECLGVLNDRRSTTLEPLHSLRRFAYAKRKRWHQRKRMDFLDLANEDFSKLEPNLNYKVIKPACEGFIDLKQS